ncbi:MAG: aldehyde-activating protein, partial [Pseudoalteromonadaceae bacterium]
PHHIGSALPKYQTGCCKFNLERSTDPNAIDINYCRLGRKE